MKILHYGRYRDLVWYETFVGVDLGHYVIVYYYY